MSFMGTFSDREETPKTKACLFQLAGSLWGLFLCVGHDGHVPAAQRLLAPAHLFKV